MTVRHSPVRASSAVTSIVVCVALAAAAHGQVGTFAAAKDNTLYEPGVGSFSNGGTFSNGAGDYFFAGRTGQAESLSIRRALLAFDLSTIPANVDVNGATLTLRMSKSAQAGAATVSLHRALASWGEGTSNAPGAEGEGTFAHAGDATWLHRSYDAQLWTNEGGDYDPQTIAVTTVGSSGFYSWSGAQLGFNVQRWLDDPAANEGWLLRGDEARERTAKRFDSRTHTDPTRRPRLVVNYAPITVWTQTSGGEWGVGNNWSTGVAPDGVDAAAKLPAYDGQMRDITLNGHVTLGKLKIDSDNPYTIGLGSLTFDVTAGNATLGVARGHHLINVPVALADDLVVNTAALSGIQIATLASAPARALTKNGGGHLLLNRFELARLSIQQGEVALQHDASGTSVVGELTIAGGAAPQAVFDLRNNALVIDYAPGGSSPLPTIAVQVGRAYSGGTWLGPGITSTAAIGTPAFGVGYAETSAVFTSFPATFAGVSVDASAVLLAYARYGDADLNGVVNLEDFNRLAANFGIAFGGEWSEGDFTYDRAVNLNDFNRLAANFGLSAAGASVTPDDWAALAAAVPEPASVLMAAAACVSLRRRGRRHRSCA